MDQNEKLRSFAPGDGRKADPWALNEQVRRRRLREDGRRPLAVNLSEGLDLSELLSRFTGSARRG